LRYEAPHRNAVWQADHKQPPLLVVAPGGRPGRRPWVTLFMDDFSRAIVGWAISLQPSSAEVLAAMRDAILVDPERMPLGGVPGRLRWDHGLEFAASAVGQAALMLGVDVDPATPYAPHEKGKVERLHRTITDSFVAGLPCRTGGPRDHRGQLEASGAPLALAELVSRFDACVQADNAERPHRSLGERTAWNGTPGKAARRARQSTPEPTQTQAPEAASGSSDATRRVGRMRQRRGLRARARRLSLVVRLIGDAAGNEQFWTRSQRRRFDTHGRSLPA
jgi:transposase InsO family protein